MINFRRSHPSTGVATIFSDFSSELSEEKFQQSYHDRFNNVPSSNIFETDDAFNIEMAIPGKRKEDFKIEIDKHVLHVNCTKEFIESEEKLHKAYTRQEYNYDNFCRSFSLPGNINDEAISAKYVEGILYIVIPKREEPIIKKKEIEIS